MLVAEAPDMVFRPNRSEEELTALFEEIRRLVSEAATRSDAGEFLPALSSLAALPAVHGKIVDSCSARLDSEDRDSSEEPYDPVGLYL